MKASVVAAMEPKATLVVQAQHGDREALTALMKTAVPTVAAIIKALAPWVRDRDDLIQEALVRAITHLGSLRDPARFGAYLNEITRNLVFDLSRRDRGFKALPEELSSGTHDALAQLDAVDRQVVLLRHWTGANYEEIARVLGLTVSAVQSRLFRARRVLRERIGTAGAPDLASDKEP
jgi:RNA polymerase sigma-70 factor (ECF subfamily)